MFKILFDDKQKGSFSLMKLPVPNFISAERKEDVFLVNQAVIQALEQEGIRFSTLSKMTFCCDDFYNFFVMNHIGKSNLPGALFPDKLYYLYTTNDGMIYPEGSPIIYCSWCGKKIDYSGY
jgi:hypothetical protein